MYCLHLLITFVHLACSVCCMYFFFLAHTSLGWQRSIEGLILQVSLHESATNCWPLLRKSTLQRYAKPDTATHCNTLQHAATHSNTLQHTSAALQRNAILCVAVCCSVWVSASLACKVVSLLCQSTLQLVFLPCPQYAYTHTHAHSPSRTPELLKGTVTDCIS